MKPEQKEFLNLQHFPAVLNREEVAWRLGFEVHEIDILISAKRLKPLGKPPRTGKKQFASIKVEALASDEEWLDTARQTILRFWEAKNKSRRYGDLDKLPSSEPHFSRSGNQRARSNHSRNSEITSV